MRMKSWTEKEKFHMKKQNKTQKIESDFDREMKTIYTKYV